MNQDEIIWNVINDKFCSYKVKSVTQKFCRNEYNATGLCSRTSCPLANSRYATIREHEGIMYLYVKTPERAHTPANMWEKIKLNKGFAQALEQIDNELIYWPNAIINRCKQRLTKISQYLVTMRKLKLKNAPKMVGIKKKIERREATRERKAEIAAHLEKSIEKELLERLKNKAYGDAPLNVNEDVWNKILESEKLEAEDEESEEENEEELEREMEMGLEDDDREFVADLSDDDEDDLEDFMFEAGSQESDEESDDEPEEQPTSKANNKRKQAPTNSAKDKRKKRGQAKLEIEYEHEAETRRH